MNQLRLIGVLAALPLGACAASQHQLRVTGAGQALSRVTAEPVNEYWPSLAPDGTTVLFDVKTLDGDKLTDATIVGVDPNTGARRTLFTPTTSQAEQSSWLPDSSSFVYTSNSPGSWSLVRSLSSSPNAAVSVIMSGEVAAKASRPTVSPDGKRVAFATEIRGTWQIAVAGVDGSRFTLLGEGENASWGPDGKRLAFQRKVNNTYQIFMLDPDTGTNLVQLTSGENENVEPSWSPDGRYLAFTSNRGWQTRKGASREGTRNLYILRPDGTGLTQLTDGEGRSDEPCWGRDGWIYFRSDQIGTNFDIWRLRPAGEFALASPVGATASASAASAPSLAAAPGTAPTASPPPAAQATPAPAPAAPAEPSQPAVSPSPTTPLSQ